MMWVLIIGIVMFLISSTIILMAARNASNNKYNVDIYDVLILLVLAVVICSLWFIVLPVMILVVAVDCFINRKTLTEFIEELK